MNQRFKERPKSEEADQLQWRFRPAIGLSSILILILLCVCLVLNWELYRVRKDLAAAKAANETPTGMALPRLEGHRITGEPVGQADIHGNSESALLFVFGSACPVCARNWPQWHTLMTRLPRAIKPIGVDLWDTVSPEYLNRVRFPQADTLTRLTGRSLLAYRFHLVPQTILLNRNNQVVFSHIGVLDEEALQYIIHAASLTVAERAKDANDRSE